MEPADTFEHAGLTVEILWEEFDTEHANPRSDDGHIGVMFCDYRGYTLGDDNSDDDPRDKQLDCDRCEGAGYVPWEEYEGGPADADEQDEMPCPKCETRGYIEVSPIEYLVRERGARVILPLFVYEHGGITMRAGANLLTGADNMVSRNRFVGDAAGWDTSTVGFIFDTTETRKECGMEDATAEQIEPQLQDEVKYYAAYLEGQVFGYRIVDKDGEDLESCWGFLELNVHDDDAYVREQAREMAEYHRDQIANEKAEAYRWACADVVTV